ncbi:MAG: hypothetical protein LBO00_10280 [Zoogloeaceae bacterium]|jgi:hypothetical protein|nr:hypothetical protein [Zoogloeaceae bacterium]
MDKYEKRRATLKGLVDSLGRGGIATVAARIGKEPNYVSRMLYPLGKLGRKRIGEDSMDALVAEYPEWFAELQRDVPHEKGEPPPQKVMEPQKQPKTPPTEEQIQDSIRLRKLFADRAGMSQLEFEQAYGVGNQGMVWQYLNADKPKGSVLNIFAAIKFAEELHCLVSDFSPSIQEEIDRIALFSTKKVGADMKEGSGKDVLENRRIRAVEMQKQIQKDTNDLNELLGITNQDEVRAETVEVVRFIVGHGRNETPEWADSDARAYAEALQYKAHKWLTGGEKKTKNAA